MTVTLRQPLTLQECQQVLLWRNDPAVLPMLRTGAKTEEEQTRFYRDVILADRPKSHEYYAIELDGFFVGMGGLTHLTSRSGEISLILGPEFRSNGIGSHAVKLLLDEAYGPLGLTSVVGECYASGNLGFWTKQILERPATLRWTWEKSL